MRSRLVAAALVASLVAIPAHSASVAEALVQATNAQRTRAGLSPLRPDARLMQAAQIQADQMARAGRLDHVLPDAPRPTARERLASVGYRWTAYGENIASGAPDVAGTVKGWMSSPGHRRNILEPSYEEIGAGHAEDARGRPYYVEVFGRPAR